MEDVTLSRPLDVSMLEAPSAPRALRIAAKGLSSAERGLLAGLVKVSQRDTRQRTMPLAFADDAELRAADVLIVDARDPAALAWARQQPWLSQKAVLWIDAAVVPPMHVLARRPVQWPVLHILLQRALDQLSSVGATAVAPVAPAQVRELGQRKPSVLVVDDSSVARVQLRTLLEPHQFRVTEAGSAQEAFDLIARQRFDCVFMDVVMPAIDGYEACRRIKALRPMDDAVPVVMLTSKASPFDRIRGKMAGCDAYLAKPVSFDQLSEVLAQQMHVHVQRPARSATGMAPGVIPGLRPA